MFAMVGCVIMVSLSYLANEVVPPDSDNAPTVAPIIPVILSKTNFLQLGFCAPITFTINMNICKQGDKKGYSAETFSFTVFLITNIILGAIGIIIFTTQEGSFE
jgi:hypothetical protein